MKLIPAVWFSLVVGVASVHGQPSVSDPKLVERIAQLQDLVGEVSLDTNGFQEARPLARFLAELSGRLPKEKKIVLRIDEQAFGKDRDKVAAALVKLREHPKKMTLAAVLRMVLAQLPHDIAADFAFRPPEVVLTLPRLAWYAASYDVREEIELMPRLLPDLKRQEGSLFDDVPEGDGPALLLRVLGNWALLPDPEHVQMVNGARLIVHAAPARHSAVRNALAMLRRQADLGVYMNARLYEVDRAFHAKHIAPLLAGAEGKEAPWVSPAWSLVQKIHKQKLLLESDDDKLLPGRHAVFLSCQRAFHYFEMRQGSKPKPEFGLEDDADPDKEGWAMFGTGLTGVAFEVKPLISPDRRHLRLHITQKTSELVKIDKVKRRDKAAGKEIDVDVPSVKRTSRSGLVEMPDLGILLVPVAYRPPGKDGADKVWVLLARPTIWIEEEVKRLRDGGKKVTPRGSWDIEPEMPEVLPPPGS